MCVEYSQASNLEFMIRYGFKVTAPVMRLRSDVEANPYSGRHFELAGEALQSYCSPVILRHHLPEVVANSTIDCHRQARYLAFEQQYNSADVSSSKSTRITPEEKLQQDLQIYSAIQQACLDLYKELETPPDAPKLKCVDEFYSRRIRADLVQPVNTDTVEIATRIAGEILSKYKTGAAGGGEEL
eukprot:g3985.t1